MEGESKRPRDTREFVTQWSTATEEHLVIQMRRALADLSSRGVLPSLNDEQSSRVAPMLVHAFQLAAGPGGGAHVAIQYLSEIAHPTAEGKG